MKKLLLFFACFFVTGDLFAGNGTTYFVVHGVQSLNKIQSSASPIARCGYFEIIYLSGLYDPRSGGEVKNLEVVVQPDEYCNLSGFVFAHPTLIVTESRDGKNYLIGYEELRMEQDDSLYLANIDKIKDWGLEKLVKKIKYEDHLDACTKKVNLSPRKMELLSKKANVVDHNGRLCYSKGVFLKSFL